MPTTEAFMTVSSRAGMEEEGGRRKTAAFSLLFLLCAFRVSCESVVPALFVFGDSLVDNGNNNDLSSMAKSNFYPYGVDFSQGPTGRFSNGKTIVDLFCRLSLSLSLGLLFFQTMSLSPALPFLPLSGDLSLSTFYRFFLFQAIFLSPSFIISSSFWRCLSLSLSLMGKQRRPFLQALSRSLSLGVATFLWPSFLPTDLHSLFLCD